MLRRVRAIRYVLPFRQGGSVPALIEADDLGQYVVKLRGAAQGPKALIAELIGGELARAAGLAVPELVIVDLAKEMAEAEPDPELAHALEASVGVNVGLDYLPGSITFDPIAGPMPDADVASGIVLVDALLMNVDRTPRNTNLLSWHERLWLIDHGAALYFHHGWGPERRFESVEDPFAEIRSHVLLQKARALQAAAARIRAAWTDETISRVVDAIPAPWLEDDAAFSGEAEHRSAYREWLGARVKALPIVVDEVERAQRV